MRFITAIAAALIILSYIGVAPVAADENSPLFHECVLDAEGNIIDCPARFEQVNELYPSFGAGSAEFWVNVEDVDGSHKTYSAYLEQQGFEDSPEAVDALEEHTTCELTADVAAHGEFTVTTTVGDFTYNDEPTWERHAKDLMRSPVTVRSTDVRIHEDTGETLCQFDMAEILNRGMEVDGRFLEWRGRKPVMGDETGSMGEVTVNYDTGDELALQPGDGGTSDVVYVDGGHIRVEGGSVSVDQVGEKKEGESWVDAAIGGITDIVGGDGITGAILRAITGIFMEFVRTVHEFIWTLITWTPSVTGNPAVEEIHRLCLQVSIMLSVLVIMLGGILYQTGPIFGISYSEIRLILPRVLAANVFAAFSLPLLQYAVEFTRIMTQVFMPFDAMTIEGYLAYSAAAILVIIVDSVLLLTLVILFVVRGAYILLGAAVSPLLALGWAFPYTKKYAQSFTGAWWAALAMAPADMLVLRFVITLPQHGGDVAGTLGNWVYALAASFLLIAVPWQLYQASGMVSGPAMRIAYGARQTFNKYDGWDKVKSGYRYAENRLLDREPPEEETPAHQRGFGRRRY